jgi:AcrR family transcriptional regulator
MNERPETTADTLIQAARRLFAQHGYDGASVRAITAEAGANLGAITYHFGSKRELYDRVVGSVVAPLAERIVAVTKGPEPVLDRVEAVVQTYFAHLTANPDMPRLMMQELVLGGIPSAAVGAPLSRVHGALKALIQEGQSAGEIRAGEAGLLAIFIISIPVHLALVQVPLRAFTGLDLQQTKMRDQAIVHATRFVRAGLAVGGEESAG